MKTLRQSLLAALMTAGTAVNAQTNLLSNGSFESLDTNGRPQGWGMGLLWNPEYTEFTLLSEIDWESEEAAYFDGTGNTVESSNDVPAGNSTNSTKSGAFNRQPEWNPNNISPYFRAYTTSGTVPVNGTLKLSFWAKVNEKFNLTGDDPQLNLSFSSYFNDFANPPSAIKNEAFNTFENEWIFLEREIPSSTIANDYLILGFGCNNCEFKLDDVKLIDVNDLAVSDVKANTKLNIYRDNGVLYVAQKEKETIEVYNTAGQLLKKVPANTQVGTTKIEGLPRNQMLIIRSGTKSAKAIL